ncbi:helix-turn-helix domain-containing protein [Streptomyces sp. NPDC047974]|uniref:IclR family transcriptional regulator n=1 Tax=Streptomyces sp. NPDC047974 TaxID=3154343 RepID=UPI0033FCE96F
MRPAQPNQSLIDGLACLQVLASHAEPVGSRELGRMLGLEPTRVNRLLKTLAYVGLAQQDAHRKYLPGPGIHVLAAQSLRGSGLIRRALGPLESLFDLGHQVAMGVLWGDQVCYLYHSSPGESPGAGLGREPLYPAAASGLGQALLARLDDEAVRELYDGSTGRHPVAPSRHPVDTDALSRTLATVRDSGYALVKTLEPAGYRTLAVALDGGDAAAIGVAGLFPDEDVPGMLARLEVVRDEIDSADGEAGPAVRR